MSAAGSSLDIRRILVALDASPQSLAALEAATQLASRFEAELIGIFVEDINLIRLAHLPFAREVSRFSATPRHLDSPQIELQLRARARRVHQAMAAMTKDTGLRWSFRVARGVISVELIAAALEADIVILGKTGWSGRRRVGSTTRTMIVQSPRQVLILQRKVRLGVPITVAFDGSETGHKALEAARLVWIEGGPLNVLLLADDSDEAQRLQAEAGERLGKLAMEAQFSWRPNLDGPRLARLLRTEGCGVLVLPAESEQISGEILLNLLNEIECAVLLVR
jgi:nucleotide-binding universal stress UspA family protein